MSRILNPETGEYEATVPTALSPPSASGLPRIQKDPFADVDHNGFDRADQLTLKQLTQMGDIAASRGDTDASMNWKMIANDRAIGDEAHAAAERMQEILTPKPMPPHGTQVIAVPGSAPWEQDSEYQRLQSEVAAAAEITKANHPPAQQIEADKALADAQAALKDREAAIREHVTDSGQWTEQDERVLDAQRSLAEKAAALNPQSGSGAQ